MQQYFQWLGRNCLSCGVIYTIGSMHLGVGLLSIVRVSAIQGVEVYGVTVGTSRIVCYNFKGFVK